MQLGTTAGIAAAIGLTTFVVAARPGTVSVGQETQAPQGAGIIEGVVVDGITGRPVPGQTVRVSDVPPESTRFPIRDTGDIVFSGAGRMYGPVRSDAAGKFRFTSLPPGWFEISVYGRGMSAYGQVRPGDPPLMISLATGERRSGLRITQFTMPVISGRVLDERGRPVVAMPVEALPQEQSTPRNRSSLTSVTDDRGFYTLSAFPGEFVIAAVPPRFTQPNALIARPVSGRPMVYPRTFAPGTLSVSDAARVTLRMGDDVQGHNIRMQAVPAYTVTITTPVVGPKGYFDIRLIRNGTTDSFGSITDGELKSGRIVFSGVPQGTYDIVAFISPQMPYMTHGVAKLTSLPEEPTLSAIQPVTIVDRNVSVNLMLHEGFRMSGSVVFEGGEPPPLEQMRVIVVESADDPNRDLRGLYLSPQTFATIQLPAGKYLLRAIPPQDWFLKSISLNGQEVMDAPIDVTSRDVTGITITYSTRTGRIRGVVALDGAAESVRSYVTVFTADRTLWPKIGVAPSRLAQVLTGATGNYDATLPPGTYYVAATTALVNVPSDFEALAATAQTVVITEGVTATQDLARTRRLR